jgi:hypothetical protein
LRAYPEFESQILQTVGDLLKKMEQQQQQQQHPALEQLQPQHEGTLNGPAPVSLLPSSSNVNQSSRGAPIETQHPSAVTKADDDAYDKYVQQQQAVPLPRQGIHARRRSSLSSESGIASSQHETKMTAISEPRQQHSRENKLRILPPHNSIKAAFISIFPSRSKIEPERQPHEITAATTTTTTTHVRGVSRRCMLLVFGLVDVENDRILHIYIYIYI